MWDFADHDSVFEFGAEGRSDAYTRHFLHINTLFELLKHRGLQKVDLSLGLLLQVLNQLIPSVGQF